MFLWRVSHMFFVKNRHPNKRMRILFIPLYLSLAMAPALRAGDIESIRNSGVLRHLGIPYANFVRETVNGVDGLDVELMQLFAAHLGVKYQYVKTCWSDVFSDITGRRCIVENGRIRTSADADMEIRGDIVANGLTILPYRKEIVDYSTPTFPTGVWLAARAKSSLKPITPSGNVAEDIAHTKMLLREKSVLSMRGTCLDPSLYDLDTTGATILFFTESENLNELAPAVIRGVAETTLLDIPDALVAIQKWPGDLKIIGPVSQNQVMGVAVSKTSPGLLHEFNRFFEQIWKNGTYKALVTKYYPSVYLYLGDFFDKK